MWEGVDLLLRTVVRIPETKVSNHQLDRPPARKYELFANYPNPFNQSTRIQYQLLDRGHVNLSIVDLAGHIVRTLVNQIRKPGRYSVIWDGKDENGIDVSSGVYLCVLQTGEYTTSSKMTLLR